MGQCFLKCGFATQARPEHPEPKFNVPRNDGVSHFQKKFSSGGNSLIQNENRLDKAFGYGKNFSANYELGDELGRGHFGRTYLGTVRKGDLKGKRVAVKIISKAKIVTSIAIEDVRKEVKILGALTGHPNLVHFYEACEDNLNVYIVMELCEGGELHHRMRSRGGRYTEKETKVVVRQILSIAAFCHLQGVVHRDLKPENILFATKDESAPLKVVDFGLSEFIKPDERFTDIAGSAPYLAPEVLQGSCSIEADVWSIGVVTYNLLCGSRPFSARSESGIFQAVLRADPSFDRVPWPSVSPEAKDFIKRLLRKDPRKRISAAQALAHPWVRDGVENIPLDALVYKLVPSYLRAPSMKRAALRALSKTLTQDEVIYLRAQFTLLQPNGNGRIAYQNFRTALLRNSTEAMKESRVFDVLSRMEALTYKKLDFEEFCAASISVRQIQGTDQWEQRARDSYEFFETDGNRVVAIEELAREVGLGPTCPHKFCTEINPPKLSANCQAFLYDWVRHSDGKLSFIGFSWLLHGVTPNMATSWGLTRCYNNA